MTSTISQQLHGWDPFGAAKRWRLIRVAPYPALTSALSTRIATLDDGTEVIIRTCPPGSDPALRAATERLLDNEIRAGVRLARRYPRDGYPPELAELTGYSFEGAEPFAVLAPYRGAPAVNTVPRLIGQKPKRFVTSLLRGVAHFAAVDLVHGAINLNVLYVDGADDPRGLTVQLVGFEHTVAIGERRPSSGPAHPGDDMLAVGRLLATAFAELPAGCTDPPDLGGIEWLERALAGVFAEDPAKRPSVSDVLRRFASEAPPPRVSHLDVSVLEAGRRRFDEIRARASVTGTAEPQPARVRRSTSSTADDCAIRRPSSAESSARHAAPEGSAQRRSSSGSGATFIVILMVVAAVVVLLALAWTRGL